MKSAHIQHLYNRIGFGITHFQLAKIASKSKKKIVDQLFKDSQKTTPLEIDISFINNYTALDIKNRQKRQEFQKLSRKKVIDYNFAWLDRLANPTELLREKMTLFWANHFVCESKNILFVTKYNNLLRENALGNFGSFVKKVSKEPAMLDYLNNRQNKKGSLNENFSRELMELFTLGQDQYSQQDIKEAARAFTGYNRNFRGEFKFIEKQHDTHKKTFFDKTSNFNGDDIIDLILEKKQCARFICEKIYRYFVNDTINKNNVDEMIAVFYKDYNIEKLMRFVFTSSWFYDDINLSAKIKSPIEFLIGLNTIVPYKILEPKKAILLQRLLGQILLQPPNVAGWKTGKYWIDSNTIVTRLRLPSVLLNNAQITYSDKGNEESMSSNFSKKKLQRKTFIKTTKDWSSFDKNFEKSSQKDLIYQILGSKINSGTEELLLQKLKVSKQDFCVQLMSLPEYQLC